MLSVDYSKSIFLSDGINIEFDIVVPVNENTSISNEEYNFVGDIIFDQNINGLKTAIENYKRSDLPNRFIKQQKFIVTNKLGSHTYGMFLYNDFIVVDADCITGLVNKLKNSFLLGHEVGHKILKYRDNLMIFKEIAEFLGVSLEGNDYLLNETFADVCGNIVSGGNYYHVLGECFDSKRNEAIKRRCLYNIYN